MEVQSKPWYESVTVWGVIVTALAGIAGLFGLTISPETQHSVIDIVPKAAEALATRNWVGAIELAVTLVGTIMTAVGRNQAVQPVHYFTPFKVKVEPSVLIGHNGEPALGADK